MKAFPVTLDKLGEFFYLAEGARMQIVEPLQLIQEDPKIFPLQIRIGMHKYTVDPAYLHDKDKFTLLHQLQKFSIPVEDKLQYVTMSVTVGGKLWKEYLSKIRDLVTIIRNSKRGKKQA